jgi:IPT/TIG domain
MKNPDANAPQHQLDAEGHLVRLEGETDEQYAARTAQVLHSSGQSSNHPSDVAKQYDEADTGGGEEGVEGAAPVIDALSPNNAVSGDAADITMNVMGSGFMSTSVIVFDGHDEPTTFISASTVSTGVKPSLFVVPAVCPVSVRNADGTTSNTMDFEFTGTVGAMRRRG